MITQQVLRLVDGCAHTGGMKRIEHVTDIDADPATVWAVLADVAAYPEWNPFLTIARLPERVGDRLDVTFTAGKRTTKIRPTVTVWEPGRTLCWKGTLGVPGIFDGAHELHVEPREGGGSRFVHRETFRGILVPFVPGILRSADAGFAAMNAALKDRAEARAATRAVPSSG